MKKNLLSIFGLLLLVITSGTLACARSGIGASGTGTYQVEIDTSTDIQAYVVGSEENATVLGESVTSSETNVE